MPHFIAIEEELARLRANLVFSRLGECRCVPRPGTPPSFALKEHFDLEVRRFDPEAKEWSAWEAIPLEASRDRWPDPLPEKAPPPKALTLTQRVERIEDALRRGGTLPPA